MARERSEKQKPSGKWVSGQGFDWEQFWREELDRSNEVPPVGTDYTLASYNARLKDERNKSKNPPRDVSMPH